MKKIIEIPFNQLITYKLEGDTAILEDETVDKIAGMVREFIRDNRGPSTFDLCKFKQNITWIWMTDKGALPTRVRKWVYENVTHLDNDTKRKVKLPDTLISDIGNVARQDTPKEQEYYFDISDDLRWKGGEFGDRTTCFFNDDGSPGNAIKRMEASGNFKAVRFFNLVPAYKAIPGVTQYYINSEWHFIGKARCWMYKPPQWENYGIIFNGYGMTTKTIGQILGQYCSGTPKKVPVRSEVYTNGDGFIVGNIDVYPKKNILEAEHLNASPMASYNSGWSITDPSYEVDDPDYTTFDAFGYTAGKRMVSALRSSSLIW